MAFEFHLPDLAEGMVEAEIVSWKVKVGDVVALDQPVVEVMSDKATVEIPAPAAGTIQAINFAEGDIAEVGAVLFVIAQVGDEAAPLPAAARTGNGSSKAAIADAGPSASTLPEVVDASGDRERVLATPATRRLARQLNVDLARVPGTGRNGRVTADDVKGFANGGRRPRPDTEPSVLTSAAAPEEMAARPAPVRPAVARAEITPVSIAPGGDEERVPFRGVRKRIADNMARSTQTAAHFTYVEEVDVTELVAVRDRAKARAEERGIKLTYLPFIIKAVVAGLKRWPQLNAALDESTQEIVRKKYYHLGIAAQGPQGLVVTVVRDADRRSIFDIAAELARLAEAVQNGTIKLDELTGSTFTISSLGKLGGVLATPILNFPEVGILGIHKIEQRPAVRNGEIVPRWLMNLSISLDHRLVDGWDGAMFLQDVKALLEDPTTMFMEMV
jgi:pyruvate dehydrogenase E2 component (dihydrolipoamide acetyltransferase)